MKLGEILGATAMGASKDCSHVRRARSPPTTSARGRDAGRRKALHICRKRRSLVDSAAAFCTAWDSQWHVLPVPRRFHRCDRPFKRDTTEAGFET
jgi:hypothetical protein